MLNRSTHNDTLYRQRQVQVAHIGVQAYGLTGRPNCWWIKVEVYPRLRKEVLKRTWSRRKRDGQDTAAILV
jgi:hypothetical protein